MSRKTLTLLILMTAMLVSPPTVRAGDDVKADFGSDQIILHTAPYAEGHVLHLRGPDAFAEETRFESGETPVIPLYDSAGYPLPDGLYRWELRPAAEPRDRERDEPAPPGAVFSGSFTVLGGAFVDPELPETFLTKDQVVADDLVVQNSACFGLDCVNGENFGSDTIRLKENNLRIHFDDTSSSEAFAANDWRITINDNAAGGLSYFSIDDATANQSVFKIEAGAPKNGLYVASNGKVGLGTSTPDKDLNLVNGDTPTLRLEQDGSSGFAAQTWDVAGNETNFFIRDQTTGNDRLVFRIKPGAPTNSLYVSADGDVGLGTQTPDARLDVDGSIVLSGTVDGRDVAADGSTLDAHIADFDNPHQVTAAQIGAISQAALDAHTGDLANPHQVTAAQAGADPAGTAAAAVAAHEAAFNHGNLPSALPVPVAEGGTGATDAAAARANLGIADDPTQTGILLPASFAGDPATATVTFAAPYPTGTSYVVLLTAFSNGTAKVVTPYIVAKDEIGFTVALGGSINDLVEVDWLARPTTVVPASGGVSCALGTQDVWNDGYVLDSITVTNEGSATITAWAVVLQFPEPTTIANSWNAELTLSSDGTVLDAVNTSSNGTLAPGQSTTFGFQGTHDGSFDLPTCTGN